MYKCPKCDHWMQYRYHYGQAYWICNQCGYYPGAIYSKTTNGEKDKNTLTRSAIEEAVERLKKGGNGHENA